MREREKRKRCVCVFVRDKSFTLGVHKTRNPNHRVIFIKWVSHTRVLKISLLDNAQFINRCLRVRPGQMFTRDCRLGKERVYVRGHVAIPQPLRPRLSFENISLQRMLLSPRSKRLGKRYPMSSQQWFNTFAKTKGMEIQVPSLRYTHTAYNNIVFGVSIKIHWVVCIFFFFYWKSAFLFLFVHLTIKNCLWNGTKYTHNT